MTRTTVVTKSENRITKTNKDTFFKKDIANLVKFCFLKISNKKTKNFPLDYFIWSFNLDIKKFRKMVWIKPNVIPIYCINDRVCFKSTNLLFIFCFLCALFLYYFIPALFCVNYFYFRIVSDLQIKYEGCAKIPKCLLCIFTFISGISMIDLSQLMHQSRCIIID